MARKLTFNDDVFKYLEDGHEVHGHVVAEYEHEICILYDDDSHEFVCRDSSRISYDNENNQFLIDAKE